MTSRTRQGAVLADNDTQATHKPPLSRGKWDTPCVSDQNLPKLRMVTLSPPSGHTARKTDGVFLSKCPENLYQTTRRHTPEDGIRRGHRCENRFGCLSRRPICSCVGGHDMLQLKVGQLQFEACGLHKISEKGIRQ